MSDEIKPKFTLDSFVTVVDAHNLKQNLLGSHKAQEQVAFADIILINKTDLISSDELVKMTKRLRGLNPIAC